MPRDIQIQIRRGSAARWGTINPVLADGEMGLESDTRKFKFGDGSTPWANLEYVGASAAETAARQAADAALAAVDISLDARLDILEAAPPAGFDITALPASSGVTVEELVAVVDNPSGTPIHQKATAGQVFRAVAPNNNTWFGESCGASLATGSLNAFFGANSGAAMVSGSYNAFFGCGAGMSSVGGIDNAFFGYKSGMSNTYGSYNCFFGFIAGRANTTGNGGSFFGYGSGRLNTSGLRNSFFGYLSGFNNTVGNSNVFFGCRAGYSNVGGSNGTFFGYRAGYANGAGAYNTFIGRSAGYSNTTGSRNTVVGYSADTGNFSNCIVLGSGAVATASNDLVLGGAVTQLNTAALAGAALGFLLVNLNGTRVKVPYFAL